MTATARPTGRPARAPLALPPLLLALAPLALAPAALAGDEQALAAAIRRAQQRGGSANQICAMAAAAAAPGRDRRFLEWLAGVRSLTCGAEAEAAAAAPATRLNGRRISLCSHGAPCHNALVAALRGRSTGTAAWAATPYGRIPVTVPAAAAPAAAPSGNDADAR